MGGVRQRSWGRDKAAKLEPAKHQAKHPIGG